MERIQNFKSFSTLKTQLREEAENQQKEVSRGEAAASFNGLLKKYNVTRASELTEDQLEAFTAELFDLNEEEAGIAEGRAFIFAASKAKREGKKEFEWNGKKYPITLKESETEEAKETEEVNEGKRERSSVVNAWKKSGVKELNAIARVYADAMEDANFHQEIVTSKAIGSASRAKGQGQVYSDIANAAKWDGYAIANGTVDYLKEIGENDAADKLLNAITKFNLNESVNLNSLEQIIEEGTRGQFGKIYKSGEIASVYTHYDSYPEHMLPTIKKGYKSGSDVDAVITKGDNSGLEADIDKIKFYNDKKSMKPLTGSMKNLKKYINDADANGAEYAYLYDERDGKWYMIDIYGDRELVPAFESVEVNEGISPEVIVMISTVLGIPAMALAGAKLDSALEKAAKNGNEFAASVLSKLRSAGKAASSSMRSESVVNEENEQLFEAEVEMDAMDPDNKDFLKFLKKNNVKIINKQMDGPAGGHPVILMQGKRKDLETVLADCDYGWCDEDLAEYIKESKVYEAEGDFAGWIAFFNGKKVEITKDEAKDLWSAKKLAIAKMKVPKSKESMVAIAPAVEEMFVAEAEVDIYDEVGGLIEDLYAKLNDLAEETTDAAWRKAIQNIIKNVEAVENNLGKASSKLGIVPVRESDEVEEGNAFGDAVRKAKEAGEEEFEFDGKTYKVEEAAKDEQKAMELYVSLVDLKKGKHSESELQSMSEDELFNLVQTEGGLKGAEAKNVAKELAKIAKG